MATTSWDSLGGKWETREVSKNGKTILQSRNKNTKKIYKNSSGLQVFNKAPKGYELTKGATTNPSGYRMYNTANTSLFSNKYKQIYVRTSDNPRSTSNRVGLIQRARNAIGNIRNRISNAFRNAFRGSSGS